MKKIIAIMAVVLLTASFGGAVYAQEDAHEQAAVAFLESMKTPEQLTEGISSMVDMMIQAQPMMNPYRQTIQSFYTKYLSWSALKGDYINITKELLSEYNAATFGKRVLFVTFSNILVNKAIRAAITYSPTSFVFENKPKIITSALLIMTPVIETINNGFDIFNNCLNIC